MNQNIFFFRDKCPICIQIFALLKSNNMINYFTFVDVDKTKIPQLITRVPAMIIYGKKILYDHEIFKFINTIIQQNRMSGQIAFQQNNQINDFQGNKMVNIHPQINQSYITSFVKNPNLTISNQKSNEQLERFDQQIQQNIQQTNKQTAFGNANKKVIGYVENEMNGFSDKYTFSDADINVVPQHSFVKANDIIKIYTGEKDTKLSKTDIDNSVQSLMNKRRKENEEIGLVQEANRNNPIYHEQIKQLTTSIESLVSKRNQNIFDIQNK